jgi:hypothetical protein
MGAQDRSIEVARLARKRYWRAADARIVISAWRQSRESQGRFARRYGLDPKRIGRWVSRLAEREREREHGGATPLRFHPVHVVHPIGGAAGSAWAVEIALGEGCTVRVPSRFAADDLVRALAVLSPSLAEH